MDRYRQRTIAELLKKTTKLIRPRMTTILEGKDRMQGPLDITDPNIDFASLKVCGNCRNHLDASIAQYCGICKKGHHSFCLEAPLNEAAERSAQCCYDCQHKVDLDSNQPGSSLKDSHSELSEDRMDVCQSNENVPECEEPGTSYDASDRSPVSKKMDLSWNEASPSKQTADSGGTIFDTLYKPTKTRAARKLGIRRKRVTDGFGSDSPPVVPSETDMSMPMQESSGVDATLEVGGVAPTCREPGSEESKDSDRIGSSMADIQTNTLRIRSGLEEANGNQLLEVHVGSPVQDTERALEETVTADKLAKEGNVMETEKLMGSPKLDVAATTQPVSRNSCTPLEGCLTDVSTTFEAPSMGIQEEVRVVGPLTSRDSAKEEHISTKTYAVPQMIVEEDAGERQILIVRQVSSVEELPKQDDGAHRLPAMACHTDLSFQNTSEGTHLPTAHRALAFDIPKSKSSSFSVLEDDMSKPSVFMDVKQALPSILEETDEHLSNGLINKAGHREWVLHKELTSPKVHMDIDSSFAGSETTAASLSSPNTRAAMEDEIKVCDLCGDSGYEDMLAICNECNGAEHVYCYENLMAQVPEGYWQCDVCKSKQKAGDFRLFTDIRTVNPLPSRLPSFNSSKKHSNVGNSRSRLSALLQKRRLPSEKKRGMKGIPSSQFPAKRGLPVLDAPPTKKQAVEASSPPYTPSATSLKIGLTKEGSFKIPDTGKVKFVSHTALMGSTGEGTGLSSRGSGKFLPPTGSSSSNPHNSSTSQSGQMSKGRLLSPSNLTLGPGNARVNATSQQLNMPSSSVPTASSGMKTSAALKSSESVPPFLLTLKPTGKLQPSFKSFKETSDNLGLQSSPKEGLSGPSSISSTRPLLSKTGSLKLSKGTSMGSTLEPKVRQDVNLDSTKSSSGSRNVHLEVGFVKPAESKYEAVSTNGLPEIKSKALAAMESLETHSGVDKLIKSEPAGSLQITKDEAVPGASSTSETQRTSALSSPVKEVQDLNVEQDKKPSFQVTSPQSLAIQTSKLPERVGADTLKEVSTMTSTDITQSAPLLPRPVLVIQESLTINEDGNKPSQLAVTVDADGDRNALAVTEKTSPQDDNRSSFTPRSRSFGAWVSPSYVPSLGSTRCYRCKELGHSAKNCNNRSSTVSVSSEAAGALKAALPASNVDSTCILKGATPINMDNATRNAQSNVEAIPRTKPTTETAPIIKPSSSERGVVFTQNLNSLVGETQAQVEEGQVVEDAAPSSCPLVEHVMRKDALVLKHIAESPTKVSAEGTPPTDHTRENVDGKKELDNTSMCIVNSTIVNVSNGTQSTTSSAEWQPPLLSLPSLTRSVSATLTPVSSTNVKATSPFVSRYQESLKVYPEAQIVWQGTFEVAGKAKPQVSFHGLQANPSNRALPKVREVAKKLQPLLPLEELPRGSEHNSWPVQFQKSPPINDNIALYFFASGKESYVQYYKPLVDRLIKFDLTLKGFIEDAELLIFPSNLLPPGSQCWNNFMFLWAVFRARKLPIKQPNVCFTTFESKQAGSDTGLKESLHSGVLTWGKAEDMQVDTIANKTVDIPPAAGNKSETPSLTGAEGVNTGHQGAFSDSDVVVCEPSPREPSPPCQQGPQHPMQGETIAKEEQKAQAEPFHSQPEKALATVSPSTLDSIVVKSQLLSDVFLATEGGLNLSASNESSQKLNSSIKLEEKVDTSVELVVPSAPKVGSALVRSEQGSIEKAKHSTPLMGTLPALLVCPSPRDRQEDVWTPRKLSSHSPAGHQDKDKGVRERIHEKSDKMDSGRGVSRDRDRERQREREKHKERDRDRDRSRRHSDWERERERERVKERERDRDRERERDRGRDRERERDRERWRDREERDRRGRDWDRDRDKVGDRDKGRDRGREREAERERALTRERSSRHRHWDFAEADYGRSGRHWYRHPRSRTPSRSPPGNRDLSPSRPRLDRYHRYHRSFRHSRSYSHSPDSDHGLARLQPSRAESRDLSKDSFAPKGKSPDIVAEESRAKEESVVKNSVVKGSGGDEQGNYSQRGSNSNSLCRGNSAGKERKLPIADLNLSPSEIEGNEEEGNEDEVMMSVEVAMPITVAHQDEHTSGCQELLPVDGHSGEPGECSVSAGKMCNNQSTEHLMCVDDSRSLSLINDSSGPSYFPLSVSLDGSSSCLHFFPQPMEDDSRAPSLPDLSLGLGAKERSPPQQAELPLFMQLLEPCQGSSRAGGPFTPSLDVPMISEQADLSLSLAIPEHSKRPVVNTSLRLFG